MKKSSYMKHELLGEGSFGCIFIPEIPCTGSIEVLNRKVAARQTVGKVFTYYDNKHGAIEIEKKLARLVNKWDPEGRYFGVPSKICKTSLEMVQKHPGAYQCNELNYFDKADLDQITMPYYGLDLNKYMKEYLRLFRRKFPIEFFLPMIKNALMGVKVLQEHKVIHMDIKSNNVLFDNFTLRIIDFSLLRTFGEVYRMSKFKERLSYSYFPYPLEFILVYSHHYRKCGSDCSMYRKYVENLNAFGNNSYRSFMKFHSLNEIAKTVDTLEEWVKNTPNWLDIVNNKVDVIDVYSVGTLCIDMDDYLDYSNLSTAVKRNYVKFVKTLSAIDFRERLNAVQALELYHTLFSVSGF